MKQVYYITFTGDRMEPEVRRCDSNVILKMIVDLLDVEEKLRNPVPAPALSIPVVTKKKVVFKARRKCEGCGRTFRIHGPTQRFCSPACRE